MTRQKNLFATISETAPIVPVLVIENPDHAAPLARALFNGGASSVEVTLRTPEALVCIEEMKRSCPSLLVGAGTVLSEADVNDCVKVGVDFIVTPGASSRLTQALLECPVPVCPGINTPGEAMELYDLGFDYQKFFPAGASGGAKFVGSLAGPLKSISIMPTGGVTTDNMSDYLGLSNVFAVGGSWIAPQALLNDGKFDEIESRMTNALAMASEIRSGE